MEKEKEIWMPVKDYEGHYEVSNLGRVKALERTQTILSRGNLIERRYSQHILTPAEDSNGYLHVRLAYNGQYQLFKVHRLVYRHFGTDYSQDMVICHLDNNKKNNRFQNLKAGTARENLDMYMRDRATGRWVPREKKTQNMLIFIPDEVWEKIQRLAQENMRSVPRQLCWIMKHTDFNTLDVKAHESYLNNPRHLLIMPVQYVGFCKHFKKLHPCADASYLVSQLIRNWKE